MEYSEFIAIISCFFGIGISLMQIRIIEHFTQIEGQLREIKGKL